MTRPVSAIPNLGPASQEAFARAGIHSAEEIEALGPDAAYERLLQSGAAPHFIGYYVLGVMAFRGAPERLPWRRKRRGSASASTRSRPWWARRPSPAAKDARFEAAMDEIGLRPRQRVR